MLVIRLSPTDQDGGRNRWAWSIELDGVIVRRGTEGTFTATVLSLAQILITAQKGE